MSVEKISKNVLTVWSLYTIFWLIFQVLKMIFAKISFLLLIEVLVGVFFIFVGLVIIAILSVYFARSSSKYPLNAVVEDITSVIKWAITVFGLFIIFPIVVLAFVGVLLIPCS